ncbi:hypothetical protein HED49_16775 [Ochrobactrum daejeonense]|nr:hypothetical protein [Brucella daejeonensis]
MTGPAGMSSSAAVLAPNGLAAQDWADWFWKGFLPCWLHRVQDPQGGVFDHLDANANSDLAAPKTVLTQARTLFALSHLALASGDPSLVEAARRQAEFLPRFRKPSGLYRRALGRDGTATGIFGDELARSYDQSFVILALATWNRLLPQKDTEAEIEACWLALTGTLTDPATGLLRNDDSSEASPLPAQNPHMHLYEACLQAYEMTENPVWQARAARLRQHALHHFLDRDSGSIAEFLAPDLSTLPGADGQRREPGHQWEWAWLLNREVALGGDPVLRITAARLQAFADRYGFAGAGPLQGAVIDAVTPQGGVAGDDLLLWPQTEAIKALAQSHMTGDPDAGERARALLCLMFEGWFAGRPVFASRLDVGDTAFGPRR